MNKFFHLPSLYVYLLAVVLLVTSLFYAGGLLRDGLYLMLGLNPQAPTYNYNNETFELTPAAQQYLQNLQDERNRANDVSNLVRRFILLVVSMSLFLYFWKRTQPFAGIDLAFTMRNFYFFLVAAIAFIIFFFSLGATINTTVDYLVIGNKSAYYDVYGLYGKGPVPPVPGQTTTKTRVDVEDLKAKIDQFQPEYDSQQSRKRQLVDTLAIAIVALPVFLLHDRWFIRALKATKPPVA